MARKGGSPGAKFVFHFKLDTEDVHVWRLQRFTPKGTMAGLRAQRRSKYGAWLSERAKRILEESFPMQSQEEAYDRRVM